MVLAAHWDEPVWVDEELAALTNPMIASKKRKDEQKAKMREKTLQAQNKQKYLLLQKQQSMTTNTDQESSSPVDTLTSLNIASASSQSPLAADNKKMTSVSIKSKLPKRRIVREHIHLDKSSMKLDPRPIDSTCQCYTCRNFNRAYLHHLFRAKELIGPTLVTIHNIHFMNRLMKDIRHGKWSLSVYDAIS